MKEEAKWLILLAAPQGYMTATKSLVFLYDGIEIREKEYSIVKDGLIGITADCLKKWRQRKQALRHTF